MKLVTDFKAAAEAMLSAYGNCGSPRQQKAADDLRKCIENAKQYQATPELIAAATRIHACDEVEIDDGAITSPDEEGGTGTWVSAWVWVPADAEGD
jgi:hypothetical protein